MCSSYCYLAEICSIFAVGWTFMVCWLYFERTFEKPAVKAKGLKRLKIHSKDGGSFSNNVRKPSNPKMVWRTNPTKLAIFGCFNKELSMKEKWICSKREPVVSGRRSGWRLKRPAWKANKQNWRPSWVSVVPCRCTWHITRLVSLSRHLWCLGQVYRGSQIRPLSLPRRKPPGPRGTHSISLPINAGVGTSLNSYFKSESPKM